MYIRQLFFEQFERCCGFPLHIRPWVVHERADCLNCSRIAEFSQSPCRRRPDIMVGIGKHRQEQVNGARVANKAQGTCRSPADPVVIRTEQQRERFDCPAVSEQAERLCGSVPDDRRLVEKGIDQRKDPAESPVSPSHSAAFNRSLRSPFFSMTENVCTSSGRPFIRSKISGRSFPTGPAEGFLSGF